jgi:protein-S-isoprenylcysteine O-methyltransferase Ste14
MSVQRLRVPLGFLFAAFYLYLASPSPALLVPGLGIGLVGLAVRVWATGHLEKWSRLAVTGPYRWTRNPLYLGSFVMGLGLSIAAGHPLLVITFFILFILIYRPVMRKEEEELVEAYGEDFKSYRARVPLFIPRPPQEAPEHPVVRFEWQRVTKNREYKAVIGFAVIGSYLILRMLWI